MTSPLGFKARVGSALFDIFAEVNVMYIPQDSPLVLHLPTSWRPVRSQSLPHMHVQRWDLARFRTCDRTNRRRTEIVILYNVYGTALYYKLFFPLKKFVLSDTCPIFGPLVLLFWISGDISSGFQNQRGFCLICIVEVNVMYIP